VRLGVSALEEVDLFNKSTPTRSEGAACPSPKGDVKTTVNFFVRDYVNHVMSEGVMLTEGFTGQYNPKMPMDCVEVLFWVTLPGDGREHWELGLFPAHCPLLHLPPILESFMMRRAAGPLEQAGLCWRTVPGNLASRNQVCTLSALTSPLRSASRA
jgi:hypothetical protein